MRSRVVVSTAKGDTMPNTAIKIRKTKKGNGTIYKLEPALVVEYGVVEYVDNEDELSEQMCKHVRMMNEERKE